MNATSMSDGQPAGPVTKPQPDQGMFFLKLPRFGTVGRLNEERGFGFISADGREEVFFHFRGYPGQLPSGQKLPSVGTPVLFIDFFINLPVLKTHNSTKLSLGFKNLKGCLHVRSRKFCHHTQTPLDLFCSHFVEAVKPKLTVLDGIYGLERGPFFLGTGYRLNAIVASKDPLAVDIAGARILGFDPEDVPHIALYAQRHGRSCSLEDIPKHGIEISDLVHPLKWHFDWRQDNSGPRMWDKLGIAGISLPKYDQTLCTGCAALYNPLLMMLASAHEGKPR